VVLAAAAAAPLKEAAGAGQDRRTEKVVAVAAADLDDTTDKLLPFHGVDMIIVYSIHESSSRNQHSSLSL